MIKMAGTIDALFDTVDSYCVHFNHIHLAACWSKLGNLARAARHGWVQEHGDVLQCLAQQTMRAVKTDAAGPDVRARELATICHGAAKSGAAGSSLLAALAHAAEQRVGDCNAQELANIAWAFAKAQHGAPELLDAIAARAKARLGEFKAQELSNLVWAYATAKHPAPELFDAFSEGVRPRLGEFNEQGLSNTCWAFATAKHPAPALFDAIAEQVTARPSELKPQSLSTMLWAYATAKICPAQFLDTIAEEAKPRLHEFNGQQLSTTLWGLAKLDYSDARLFAALAAAVGHRLGSFNSQDLSSTAWALAKACHVDEGLFAALARAAERRIDTFNLQDLVNLSHAFAKVGQFDAPLFATLARSIGGRPLGGLDAPHIANVAWAFSKAAATADKRLFATLARTAEQRAGDFGAQDLATIAWAFANAGHVDAQLFAALAKAAERFLDDFTAEDRDNAEWAFTRAEQQRIAKMLRLRKARSAPTIDLPAADAAACGRIVVAGCGIGGAAVAVALQKRGFDVLVLESDGSFDARKQGYGLTIQGYGQTTQAMGINLAADDAPSTSHYTFSADGSILGFYGEVFGGTSRERRESDNSGRFVHIPRQVLRQRLIEQVQPDSIRWSSKIQSFQCSDGEGEGKGKKGVTVTLTDGTTLDAALLVGADGIFSTVRQQLDLPGDRLNYVGLVVVLGILPTVERKDKGGEEEERTGEKAKAKKKKKKKNNDKKNNEGKGGEVLELPLAHRRIFETVDGSARIYAMPFTTTSTMWQLSFPYPENKAKKLVRDPAALKAEILRLCAEWHDPIPAMLEGTALEDMSGYPIYDRQPLEPRILRRAAAPSRRVTVMGDAAHPMTPFKAQGANQALSDAVLLADSLVEGIQRLGPVAGIEAALPAFEEKMLSRSSRVVAGSREKAKEMHSELALQPARKVQRETGGSIDMHKAIRALRASGIGARSALDPRGLDAVVSEAIDQAAAGQAGGEAVASPAAKKRKDPAAPAADVHGPKAVFVKNLPWGADESTLRGYFGEVGTVVGVRIPTGDDGRTRGFGYVTFDSAAGAAGALARSGAELMGRELFIDAAGDRGSRSGGVGGGGGDRPPRDARPGDEKTVFIVGFDRTQKEEDVKSALYEAFSDVGKPVNIRLPFDRAAGSLKGFGFIEFADVATKDRAAAEKNGVEILGRPLKLVVEGNPGGGSSGGGFGGGGHAQQGGRGPGAGGRGGAGAGAGKWGGPGPGAGARSGSGAGASPEERRKKKAKKEGGEGKEEGAGKDGGEGKKKKKKKEKEQVKEQEQEQEKEKEKEKEKENGEAKEAEGGDGGEGGGAAGDAEAGEGGTGEGEGGGKKRKKKKRSAEAVARREAAKRAKRVE